VKKYVVLNLEGKMTISWSGEHKHPPPCNLSHSYSLISTAISDRKRKLQPQVVSQIKADSKAGKSPRNIYREAVKSAENPLDTSLVPSKDQVKYLTTKARKEEYPFEEVSFHCFHQIISKGNCQCSLQAWRLYQRFESVEIWQE
jgi:hypothetical protein